MYRKHMSKNIKMDKTKGVALINIRFI